jgi:hypothetical protein
VADCLLQQLSIAAASTILTRFLTQHALYHCALALTRTDVDIDLPGILHNMSDDDASPAARGGFGSRVHSSEARREDCDSSRACRIGDFPAPALLVNCRVKCHEDVPRHIWGLFKALGIQYGWILTSRALARELVTTADLDIEDSKETDWMALHEHKHDLLEDTMYLLLADLWSGFSNAISVFDANTAAQQQCAIKVWEAPGA